MVERIKKKATRYCLIAFLAAVLLECLLFNFRHWESLTFAGIKSDSCELSFGTGLKYEREDICRITEPNDAYVEIAGINADVRNIYIPLDLVTHELGDQGAIPVTIFKTDAADSVFTELPSSEVTFGMEEGRYKRLNLCGNAKSLRIRIDLSPDSEIHIGNIELNKVKPFDFQLYRFFVLFFAVFTICVFCGNNNFCSIPLDLRQRWQRVIVLLFAAGTLTVVAAAGLSCRPDKWFYHWSAWEADYERLADSFAQGQFHFVEEPPKWLCEMEDPYDPGARDIMAEQTGEEPLWDVAFYNGHYYSYFGVVPVIVCYLPYRLLTGQALPSWIPVIFFGALFAAGCFAFMYALCRKFFSGVGLSNYLLMSVFLFFSSWAPSLIQRGSKYNIPFIFALTFAIWGLTFWIGAVTGEKIVKYKLVLGSLLLALVFGCRPQIGLIIFISFPLFWKEIREREFFSKKGTANTLCVLVPFILTALLLMYYNYARFGSPFDFGATYNLTVFNMPKNDMSVRKGLIGLFRYLLQPMQFRERFPFIFTVDNSASYQGFISSEQMIGGYFALNLLGTAAVLGVFLGAVRKNSAWLSFHLYLLAAALIAALFDAEMVGTVDRYMSDFAWMLSIAAAGTVFSCLRPQKAGIAGQNEDEAARAWKIILFFLVALSVIISLMLLFSTTRPWTVRGRFPKLFYKVQYHLFDFLS